VLTIILDNYDKKSRDPVKVQGLERAMAWEQRYDDISSRSNRQLLGKAERRNFLKLLYFSFFESEVAP
jgi:hypothetical protein